MAAIKVLWKRIFTVFFRGTPLILQLYPKTFQKSWFWIVPWGAQLNPLWVPKYICEYITQNIFEQHKDSRTISLNAQYMTAFKNTWYPSQINHMA